MIQLHGIRYAIGPRVLFDDSTGSSPRAIASRWSARTAPARPRCSRCSSGRYTPEAGTRVLAEGTRLGYLPQEAAEKFDGTVLDRALEAHRAHARHARGAGRAAPAPGRASPPEDPRPRGAARAPGELQHHLDMHDEHALEPEARRVLAGLGFSPADQDRPLDRVLGRLAHARDARGAAARPIRRCCSSTSRRTTSTCRRWSGSRTTSRTSTAGWSWCRTTACSSTASRPGRELDRGQLTEYATTFTALPRGARSRAASSAEAANEQLDKKVAQLSRFVERFGAKNTKASQAQSKRKRSTGCKKQHIVLPRKPRAIRFTFPAPPHVGPHAGAPARRVVRLRRARDASTTRASTSRRATRSRSWARTARARPRCCA